MDPWELVPSRAMDRGPLHDQDHGGSDAGRLGCLRAARGSGKRGRRRPVSNEQEAGGWGTMQVRCKRADLGGCKVVADTHLMPLLSWLSSVGA